MIVVQHLGTIDMLRAVIVAQPLEVPLIVVQPLAAAEKP